MYRLVTGDTKVVNRGKVIKFSSTLSVIGKIVEAHPRMVTLKTHIGGTRVVDMLSGEQLPRIC